MLAGRPGSPPKIKLDIKPAKLIQYNTAQTIYYICCFTVLNKIKLRNTKIKYGFFILTIFLSSLLISSCTDDEKYENSLVLQDSVPLLERSMDAISEVSSEVPGNFTFAVISDSHDKFGQLKEAITHINSNYDILFVIHCGDMSYGGKALHLTQSRNLLGELNKPCFPVPGNHESFSNRLESYRELFGNDQYSLEFENNLFIFFNDNFRFFQGDTIFTWIEQNLVAHSDYTNVFITAHCPPADTMFFGEYYVEHYKNIITGYGIDLSIHGHWHTYNVYDFYNDGSHYLTCGSTMSRSYSLVHVSGEAIEVEEVKF